MKNGGRTLTGRDAEVVVDLYKYRYLSVSQIQRLHFPSLQTAYRRLRALREGGYVAGFTAPHITEHVYYLDGPGAELVAANLGVAVADLKWTRTGRAPKDYYFLRHFLKVNDFRIALTLACRESEIELLGFIPEYYGERGSSGAVVKYIKDFACDIGDPARRISHTPDAVFALARRGAPALFFLEIDRGTEVVGDEEKGVLKAVKFYLNYLVEGKYHRYQGDFGCGEFKGFRALIVTTGAARVGHMREAIGRLAFGGKAKQFVWLTEDGRVSRETIFQPIWLSAEAEDRNLYRIG